MHSFGAQHPALKAFVEAAHVVTRETHEPQVRMQAWLTLKRAWRAYYGEVGDGEAACKHFTDACAAAGATMTTTTAPNCVHHALGAYIGPPSSRAAGTLNNALVGIVRRRQDGRGGNEIVPTSLWPDVLHDLGFRATRHPTLGDLVVYTMVKEFLVADGMISVAASAPKEHAVHFGVVVETSDARTGGIWVESKSGYAFHTYVHPINVVDPTYLIEAPRMRVHTFRPPRRMNDDGVQSPLALPPHALDALAEKYAEAGAAEV